jgi:hypothetical protein
VAWLACQRVQPTEGAHDPQERARRAVLAHLAQRDLPGPRGAGQRHVAAEEADQVVAQGLGGLVALLGALLQRLEADRLQVGRDVRSQGAERRGRVVLDALEQPAQLALLEGELPGQALVEGGAQAVHVGPPIHLPTHGLLGGHVGGGPEERARLRERERAALPGQPEVGDHGLVVLAHEDVVGLDVPVDDPSLVGVLQRQRGVEDVLRDRALVAQRPRGVGRERAQGAPGDELHRVVGGPVLHAGAVDLHDVGMVEGGGRAGLALEARQGLRVAREVLREDLQGHPPLQRLLPRLVDLPHGPLAHQAHDRVLAEGARRAGVRGHARGV